MNIKILVAVKKCAFTISLILTLLSTFTSCSKDDDCVVDKQFANTVWIYRYPAPYHSVYAEALVFFRDGSIKKYGLDSHDKILYHYANYSFRRVDENHISFSDKMNPILVEENRFTFVYYFYKTAYRPEDLA